MSYMPLRTESTIEQEELTDKPTQITSREHFRFSKLSRNGRNGHKRRSQLKPEEKPIIVHSHLLWDWVWQRPQQFISRLSRKRKVLFVELSGPDASLAAPTAKFRTLDDFPNITVLQMQFPAWRWSEGRYVDRERRRIVWDFIRSRLKGQFDHPIQWFYDPMAVPAFAGRMNEALTVYDCMDELSKFRFAPPEIVERESELLAKAEVVFAGGRQLYEAKRRHHNNCHFYGCGVDVEHFGQALREGTSVEETVAALPGPVFGYFGVVDERLDYDLIARLADAFPQGSVAIVGPVCKVDENTLPKRHNLHFLGRRDYGQLPAICKGFDICLMPFALNEATEYINPTKTLEYMATGKPIVSTAIRDVVSNFGEIVDIARSPEEFVAMCRSAQQAPDEDRIARGLTKAAENSWDSIVARLEEHLADALAKSSTEALA